MCDRCDWSAFLADAKALLGVLDDLPEAADDFADSVQAKLWGMIEWVEEARHVTPKMEEALDNMEAGARRWRR